MRLCSCVPLCSGGPARCCLCSPGWEAGMSLLPLPWLMGWRSIPSLPTLAFPQNWVYLSKSTSAEKLLYALHCVFLASILTFSTHPQVHLKKVHFSSVPPELRRGQQALAQGWCQLLRTTMCRAGLASLAVLGAAGLPAMWVPGEAKLKCSEGRNEGRRHIGRLCWCWSTLSPHIARAKSL